ncbi:hypothetical protein Hanom_Chr04g00357921 [Helianthus anomalus]
MHSPFRSQSHLAPALSFSNLADLLRVYVTEAEQMTARVSRLIPTAAVKVASPVAT